MAEQWYRTTALEDLLGIGAEAIYDEWLYRTLDRVLPHKEAIEAHLVKRLGELFALDYDLLLYRCDQHLLRGGGRSRDRAARLQPRFPAPTACR